MNRRPVFDFVAAQVPGIWNRPGLVARMDAAIDAALGLSPRRPTKPKGRQITRAGEQLIQEFEGCELEAYLDIAGVRTIGWGHTGSEVRLGQRITQAEANRLFDLDTDRFEAAVERLAPIATDPQFDALVSFAYNLGEGALGASTLLVHHRAGNYAAAALQFARWNKASVNGKLVAVKGLTRRRAAEAKLYRSGS